MKGAALLLLAALLLWLHGERLIPSLSAPSATRAAERPDQELHGVESRYYDGDGTLVYHLRASEAQIYDRRLRGEGDADDGRLRRFHEAQLELFESSDSGPFWRASAKQATVTQGRLELEGEVQLRRELSAPLELSSSQMSLDHARQTAATDQSAELRGDSWSSRSRKLHIDLERRILRQAGGVSTRIWPRDWQ